VIAATVALLGTNLNSLFNNVNSCVTGHTSATCGGTDGG
jgi:Flp pilus assembly pilin Flp